MMDIVKRCIKRLYPELDDGYHLPKFAIIVGIADQPINGAVVDDYRPQYAVDLQLLKPDGTINKTTPRYNNVPLPLNSLFAMPEPGTWVELAFAFGRPDKPFIRTLLSHHSSIPELHKSGQKWQQWPHVKQEVDAGHNWHRMTDATIEDSATTYRLKATHAFKEVSQLLENIESEHHQYIGGNKIIEVMEAFKVTVGEKAFIAALKELSLATDAKLKTYSKDNTELTTEAALITQSTGNTETSTDAALRQVVGSTVWLGTDGSNIIRILLDLANEVKALAATLETHTHSGPPPDQKSGIKGHKDNAKSLADELDPITEK